jgi:hypothetical protein
VNEVVEAELFQFSRFLPIPHALGGTSEAQDDNLDNHSSPVFHPRLLPFIFEILLMIEFNAVLSFSDGRDAPIWPTLGLI